MGAAEEATLDRAAIRLVDDLDRIGAVLVQGHDGDDAGGG